jgi:hypothetical protein
MRAEVADFVSAFRQVLRDRLLVAEPGVIGRDCDDHWKRPEVSRRACDLRAVLK